MEGLKTAALKSLTPDDKKKDVVQKAALKKAFGEMATVKDSLVITGAKFGAVIGEEAKGLLVLKQPWPSMARTCWGDHERFENTYFSYDGYYLTGDGARRDADGHYWITGRVDDVVVVSGHNIGTAEVESALVAHPAVSFCGVRFCPSVWTCLCTCFPECRRRRDGGGGSGAVFGLLPRSRRTDRRPGRG